MAELAAWLERIGLEKYADAFAEATIDLDVLPDLSEADLADLGVRLGDRKRLLKAIAELQASADSKPMAPSADPPPPTAERRQLTVLFCDLVGSTELSRRLDPEDLGEVMRAYHGRTSEVIRRWGGHVAKYLGDGVLAYFGWPQAHEDDPERAVRAALEVTGAVAGLDDGAGGKLAARIGIATGPVVVGELIGEGAAQEQTVLGETPNLAARLQALAAPGGVAINSAIRSLLGALFELESLEVSALKGFDANMQAFRVTGEARSESRFEARTGRTILPMVGRDQELALLLERWAQAKSGEGQGVLLVGEGGIGKSRIVRALLDALVAEPHTRIRYQCSPYHRDSTLWPVIHQLSQAAGFAAGDGNEARLDKLEALLARAGEMPAAAPLLADLLGLDGTRYGPLDLAPQAQRARTLDALVAQLLGLTARQPILLVLEDAHWIDPTTLELIEHFLDRIAKAGALILLTSRPDDQPQLAAHPHVTRLTLNRLSRAGVEAIVRRLGGDGLAPNVVDTIITRTDGVPLFVEELTKAILETGETTIPASLHDSLMARLDRLPEVKEIAQTAACIGREFDYRLLAAITDQPEPDLRAALDQLANAQLLFRRGQAPDATYTFKHALVRDAAYESSLKARRQDVHGAVAAALQQHHPDRVKQEPELLAHHLTHAGQPEQAIDFWRAAAQRATDRSAYQEAVAFYEQALAALAEVPESAASQRQAVDLRLEMRPALGALGKYRSIRNRLIEARECASAFNDRHRLAQIHADEIHVTYQLGELTEAIAVGETATRMAAEIGDRRVLIQSSFNLGQAYFFRGEHRRAIETVLPYIDDLRGAYRHERLGTTGTSACIWLGNLAGAYARIGEFDQAIGYGEEAMSIARETGRPFDFCLAGMWLGQALVTRGEASKASGVFDRVLSLAREHELGFVLAWIAGLGASEAYALAGRAQEGKDAAAEAVRHARGANLAIAETWATLGMAVGLLQTAAVAAALTHAQRGLEMAEAHQLRWSEVLALRLMGTAYRRLDPPHPQEAERYLVRAVKLARELAARPELAHACRELGQLLSSLGRREDAPTWLGQSAELYEDLGMGLWLPETRRLAQVAQDTGYPV